MKLGDLVSYVVASLIIIFIVSLLVTQLLGQPFIVFVETGSMAPTLQPNDGYIAVPAFLAGDVEEGDVILFQAQELGGGRLTTHRVVDETEQGFITRGDANPFADQDGDEPPVAEGQIKSVGLTVDGELVVIEGLGATITSITAIVASIQAEVFGFFGFDSPGVTTVSMGILVIGLVIFVLSFTRGGSGSGRRARSDGSVLQNGLVIMAILTLVVLIPVNFSMLLPSGVYQIEIVSAVDPTADERIIGAGQSGEVTYFMRNSGHIPVVVFLEPASPGVETPPGYTYVSRRTTVNQSITMHAPDETGSYLRFVREYRYLVLLPPRLIESIHGVHPLLPMVVINVEVGATVMLLSLYTLGSGRVRVRTTGRDITITQELKRRMPFVLPSDRAPPDRLGVHREAVYNWVNRAERLHDQAPAFGLAGTGGHRDPDDGARASPTSEETAGGVDERTPGRPTNRLSGRQLIETYETLQRPPDAAGLDAIRWTPDVLQAYLREEYGVRYSLGACLRLLARTGHEPEYTNT